MKIDKITIYFVLGLFLLISSCIYGVFAITKSSIGSVQEACLIDTELNESQCLTFAKCIVNYENSDKCLVLNNLYDY